MVKRYAYKKVSTFIQFIFIEIAFMILTVKYLFSDKNYCVVFQFAKNIYGEIDVTFLLLDYHGYISRL